MRAENRLLSRVKSWYNSLLSRDGHQKGNFDLCGNALRRARRFGHVPAADAYHGFPSDGRILLFAQL